MCLAIALCIFFFCAGHAFIPRLGIEDDEALFAEAIYPPRGELYSLHIGRSRIPVMLMSYLGALKSVIYAPVLRNFGVGLRLVREPMLLAGVASIWLFFLLLRRVSGLRAAMIGCALLATDSLYLLTSSFDWGPVALQHLLLLGGVYATVRFFQDRSQAVLAAAGFLFGLAVWDKALAVWTISGVAIGAVLTFPRQILDAFTLRRAAILALAFLLGAMPLVIYNAATGGGTAQGTFDRDLASVPGKAVFFVRTLGGTGLFGWMFEDDWQTPKPHDPETALESVSARISAFARHPRQSWFGYAVLLALLLAPFSGPTNRRLIALAVIASLVGWIQMAVNRATGGSIHHTILLWPLPQFIVAISFSAASYRIGRAGIPAVAVMTAILAVSNTLVLNEYFAQAVRHGGGKAWNGAIYPLFQYLKNRPAANWNFVIDWGILDQLRLLGRGKLLLAMGSDQIDKPELTPEDRTYVQEIVSTPGNVFIGHTAAFEFFPGRTGKLVKFAADAGFQRETVAVISDEFGRDVYEIFRFARSGPPSPAPAAARQPALAR